MRLHSSSRYLALTAILAALALALGAVEGLFTSFLPLGIRPGFSNIAVMMAALLCGVPSAFFVAIFKALFALMTRGGVAFAMSLAGGVCATGIMLLLFRHTRLGLVGISVLGALAHNMAQLAVAFAMLGGAVLGYAPWMILFSIPCGAVTGIVLSILLPHLQKRLLPEQKQAKNEPALRKDGSIHDNK